MLYVFCLFSWLLFATVKAAAPVVEPLPPQEDVLVRTPPGIGAWPVPKLFARQEHVCTDPAYSTQCAAVLANGNCCQTSTYCPSVAQKVTPAKLSKASRAAALPTVKPVTGGSAPRSGPSVATPTITSAVPARTAASPSAARREQSAVVIRAARPGTSAVRARMGAKADAAGRGIYVVGMTAVIRRRRLVRMAAA